MTRATIERGLLIGGDVVPASSGKLAYDVSAGDELDSNS